MKRGAENPVEAAIKLPNREPGGPIRRTLGPVTIVSTGYLNWLERGAEQYFSEKRSSSEHVLVVIPRVKMATGDGMLENSPALKERRRSRFNS